MLYHHKNPGERDQFSDLAATASAAVRTLSEHASEFDFIAVQGMSGMMIGAPAAIGTGKPLVLVRKHDDYMSGHGSDVENKRAAVGRYVFLDDFISGGRTRRRVSEKLAGYGATEVATYEYRDDKWTRRPRA